MHTFRRCGLYRALYRTLFILAYIYMYIYITVFLCDSITTIILTTTTAATTIKRSNKCQLKVQINIWALKCIYCVFKRRALKKSQQKKFSQKWWLFDDGNVSVYPTFTVTYQCILHRGNKKSLCIYTNIACVHVWVCVYMCGHFWMYYDNLETEIKTLFILLKYFRVVKYFRRIKRNFIGLKNLCMKLDLAYVLFYFH